MEHYLKRRTQKSDSAAADRLVKATVEGILDDIRQRGEAAVRDLSASASEVSRA